MSCVVDVIGGVVCSVLCMCWFVSDVGVCFRWCGIAFGSGCAQPAGDPFSSLGVLCSVMLVAVAVAVAVAACCCLFLYCVALFGEHVSYMLFACYLLIYLVMREVSMRMSVVLFSHVLLASARCAEGRFP